MTTRRGFLEGLGVAGLGTAWLSLHAPAIAAAARHAHASLALAASGAAPPLQVLTAAEARDIDAFTAAIVPSGSEGPGAHEAGIVYFIDRAFGSFFAGQRAEVLRDLAALPRPFPDFATLEGKPLFEQLRMLTVLGLFASPDYGGNRDGLGWRLINLEDTHAYQPPFGWYDRDYPGYSP
jgi:gluconate 2-dehydrogenase gamma chain